MLLPLLTPGYCFSGRWRTYSESCLIGLWQSVQEKEWNSQKLMEKTITALLSCTKYFMPLSFILLLSMRAFQIMWFYREQDVNNLLWYARNRPNYLEICWICLQTVTGWIKSFWKARSYSSLLFLTSKDPDKPYIFVLIRQVFGNLFVPFLFWRKKPSQEGVSQETNLFIPPSRWASTWPITGAPKPEQKKLQQRSNGL